MSWFVWLLAFYLLGILVMCWLATYEVCWNDFRPSSRNPRWSLRKWIWGWIQTVGVLATSWVGVARLARESVK